MLSFQTCSCLHGNVFVFPIKLIFRRVTQLVLARPAGLPAWPLRLQQVATATVPRRLIVGPLVQSNLFDMRHFINQCAAALDSQGTEPEPDLKETFWGCPGETVRKLNVSRKSTKMSKKLVRCGRFITLKSLSIISFRAHKPPALRNYVDTLRCNKLGALWGEIFSRDIKQENKKRFQNCVSDSVFTGFSWQFSSFNHPHTRVWGSCLGITSIWRKRKEAVWNIPSFKACKRYVKHHRSYNCSKKDFGKGEEAGKI